MTPPSTTDIVTAAVAALALLLSLYNLYVERRDKRTRLLVWLSQGTSQTNEEAPIPCLFVDIANPTLRRIVVADAAVIFPKLKIEVPVKTTSGDHQRAVLLPGDNELFWVPLDQLQAKLGGSRPRSGVQARARARDALGKLHYSRGRTKVTFPQNTAAPPSALGA